MLYCCSCTFTPLQLYLVIYIKWLGRHQSTVYKRAVTNNPPMSNPFRHLRTLIPRSASTTHDHEITSADHSTPLTANLFILGPPRVGKTALFTIFQDWKLPPECSASTDVGVDVALRGANLAFLSRYQQEWDNHKSSGAQQELLPTGPSANLEEVRLQPGWPVAFDAHDMPNAIFVAGSGNMDINTASECVPNLGVHNVADRPTEKTQTFSLSSWVTGCYSRFPQRRNVDRRNISVLVCFDITSRSSLQAATSLWSPPNLSSQALLLDHKTWASHPRKSKTGEEICFWLVGCKSDLRSCRRSEEAELRLEPLVAFEEAQTAALEAGFTGYRECSAMEPVSAYAVLKGVAEEQRRQIAERWGRPCLDNGYGAESCNTVGPRTSWWRAWKERKVKKEILTGSWDYCNWIKYP